MFITQKLMMSMVLHVAGENYQYKKKKKKKKKDIHEIPCKCLSFCMYSLNVAIKTKGSSFIIFEFHGEKPCTQCDFKHVKHSQAVTRTTLSCFREVYNRLLVKLLNLHLQKAFSCQNLEKKQNKLQELQFGMIKKLLLRRKQTSRHLRCKTLL